MKKEFSPLVLFLLSIIVFGLLSVFGMVYNLGKSLYECCQLKFWKGIIYLLTYWVKVLYQIWNVTKYFLMKMAIGIDLFGNVAGGELVEDFVTTEENTLYGNGDYTVSAATGQLEVYKKLIKNGVRFNNLLSKTLGKNHSLIAYKNTLK